MLALVFVHAGALLDVVRSPHKTASGACSMTLCKAELKAVDGLSHSELVRNL
jgi:hypothetical protein